MRRFMIAAALVAALVACKKEKKDEPGAATGAATATAADPGTAVATGTAPATGTDPGTAAATGTADQAAPGARPATVTDAMVAAADKAAAEFEAMGKDLTAAGTDCKKAAAALKDHSAKISPLVADIKKLENKDDKAAQKWFEDTYGPRMMTAMGGMMELSKTCEADADFKAASEDFGKALDM